MPVPEGWDAVNAVAACPVLKWEGRVWRMHVQRYSAGDAGGSLKSSGRYHRGRDQFPEDQVFSALYLATSPEVSFGEIIRHVKPETLPFLNNHRLSELFAQLTLVLDSRDPDFLDLSREDLIHDTDVEATRSIGAAAFAREVEGILAISATDLGDNLIIFPDHLRSDSRLELVSSRDPRLQPQV
jgi:RES domain